MLQASFPVFPFRIGLNNNPHIWLEVSMMQGFRSLLDLGGGGEVSLGGLAPARQYQPYSKLTGDPKSRGS